VSVAAPWPAGDERLAELATALAATRRGTLGLPRAFAVGVDGQRVCYLRAIGPDDPRQGLWMLGPAGAPRLLVHPDDLGDEVDVDEIERARRERTRELGSGITAFAGTPDLRVVTFTYNGRIHVVATDDGGHHALDVTGPVSDPRASPTGRHVAWVAGGALHVVGVDGSDPQVLADDPDPDVTWGLAEFIAAEEMGRLRGFWWSPDGTALAACRVDVGPVDRWWLHDPTSPDTPPTMIRYPAAGTPNAEVRLAVVTLDGARTPVPWDSDAMPYLTSVTWSADTPLTFAVQSRDQRRVDVRVWSDGGDTRVVRSIATDPWVTLVDGTPGWTRDGRLVTVEDDLDSDTRRLLLDGRPRSPAGLHVDAVIAVRADDVVVQASAGDPTATVVWSVPLDAGAAQPVSPLTGVHQAAVGGATVVLHSQHAGETACDIAVHRGTAVTPLPQVPLDLPVTPGPILATLSPAKLRAALLLPSWYESGPLPVLLDPYGGPHARRVRQAARGYLVSQWFAEAGLAVLVIDGRGTPGRGPTWEHAIAGDTATSALDD
jgi:dipeptidyl-peptidase-4